MADGKHSIEPFKLLSSAAIDGAKLAGLLKQLDKRITVTHESHQVHAQISSRLFGFIDDLHLIIDDKQQLIHVRSASRSGYYDFCVNRKRVEKLRALLQQSALIQ
jgi:uncharacterized protein (DUF1499 family)